MPRDAGPPSQSRRVRGRQARLHQADVHSKLFEADAAALGYPPRTRTQADGEYFLEQRHLALRRLRTKVDRRQRGHYDGLYLIGNSPVLLCEIKRYDAVDSSTAFDDAVRQLKGYAASDDFETPPPFLLLYCGKPSRNRFFRRRTVLDASRREAVEYEELDELWSWERVKEAHARGRFAEEVVGGERLLEILLHHLDHIEDDLRRDVGHAVLVVTADDPSSLMLTPSGQWLLDHPEALRRMRRLYERKVAELGRENQRQLIEEMVTQAALNYLNKVFFLNLCEDRNLEGFYRILREFLPSTWAETSSTTAAVFLALLRRKIRDASGAWRPEEEHAYRELRGDLTGQIREHVIEQNHWWGLIRVAFDLAEETFPLVYQEDAYDDFHPRKETLAELVYDLSTKSAGRGRSPTFSFTTCCCTRRSGPERSCSRLKSWPRRDANARWPSGPCKEIPRSMSRRPSTTASSTRSSANRPTGRARRGTRRRSTAGSSALAPRIAQWGAWRPAMPMVQALKQDPDADVAPSRDEVDDAIFELFEIGGAREEVRRFYRNVGLVERPDAAQAAAEAEAGIE